ncbi:MAG TPA: CaiB/BaiF CoA-transferase family protein [Dehalococcoidia bacterium]|nr:CaiB/BaiF CoA-transferase family protein [Dehalococcoidia bacterium]
MTLPLEGLRMLDISRLVPGPMTTWMLADLGMDVLKIEDMEVARAGRARDSFSPTVDDPDIEARAMAWNHVGRNKRSIAIDLQKAEGRAILHKLAESADVFFGSFRVPVYKRLGADYETLGAINPRLIYATLSGYGEDNSFADLPGNEVNGQAMSGVMAMLSGKDGEPADTLFTALDSYTATVAVIAIQSALLARERTGSGQKIDISLVEAGANFASVGAPGYLRHKTWRRRGAASLRSFRCKDGKYLISAAFAQTHFWDQFCDIIGRPQYKGMLPLRGELRREDGTTHPTVAALIADVRAVFLTRTRGEWLALFPRDLTVLPMLEYDESFESDFAGERGIVWELDHPLEGRVRQIGSPFRLSDTPPVFRNFAPMLGEHTVEVLENLGYAHPEIEQLERDGVVRISHGAAAAPTTRSDC